MHPAEIQAALKVRGYSQAALAKECGIKPATMSTVINGRSRSAQIEERISAITGYTLEELWPQWHGEAPLVLSLDERAVVLLYRELPPSAREQVLPVLREMSRDVRGRSPRRGATIVTAKGGFAAGRDQHIGVPPPKPKKSRK